MESATNRAADATAFDQGNVEATTQPFVGRWNQLVSQTNWEKGRIIQQWRDALVDAGAPAAEYADEAWSRRVGGVTGQHVGRLRRVYQRFGQTHRQFAGLYWSHFQACLDWDDAEMWLEGAVQNGWSVSQMRHQRWETMGALADQAPRDDEIVASEMDEDLEPAVNEAPVRESDQQSDYESHPRSEGPDFGDAEPSNSGPGSEHVEPAEALAYEQQPDPVAAVQPFSQIGDLPDDLAQAFEAFKLAILNHKMNAWQEISCADVVATLDALKALATAPAASS